MSITECVTEIYILIVSLYWKLRVVLFWYLTVFVMNIKSKFYAFNVLLIFYHSLTIVHIITVLNKQQLRYIFHTVKFIVYKFSNLLSIVFGPFRHASSDIVLLRAVLHATYWRQHV